MEAKYFSIRIIFLAFLVTNFDQVNPENIIALFFTVTKSTRNAADPLFSALADRGHHVTIVSSVKSNTIHNNIRDINGPQMNDQVSSIPNFFESRINRKEISSFRLISLFDQLCRGHYDLPEMKEIQKQKFDLIIVSALFNECAYGLMHHLNTTVLSFSSVAAPIWISSGFGSPTPPSFVPLHLLDLTHEMNFFQRVQNIFGYITVFSLRKFYYGPEMERIYRDYFPDTPSIPKIEEKISFILMNSHPSIHYPRPLLPNMVEIGGLHCRPPKPLPADLEEFINGSGEDGCIYFSMGSLVPGHSMPESYRKSILQAFGKLKQRVLWKWETEQMPDLPSNVKISKWLPQQDILGHPKIKLFITQGGMMSTLEAAYHGVPLIGIPMFADQDWNIRQAETAGYALALEFGDITEEVLTSRINTILTDSRFTEKAKQLSAIFRDQPESPLERAVFWTEHIMRNKGAPHLQSPGRSLTFFEYHSLDVLALFLLAVIGISSLLCCLLKMFVKSILKLSIRKVKRKEE